MMMALDAFIFRAQGDLYRVQSKFEGAQHEVDRLSMDLEKANILVDKHKNDHKKVGEELHALQEEFHSAELQLSRTKDSESKFKDDFERASMDVEMLRERLDKTSNDLAKSRAERDKAISDADKLSYELEKTTNQYNKAHNNLEKSQEEVARLQVRKITFASKVLKKKALKFLFLMSVAVFFFFFCVKNGPLRLTVLNHASVHFLGLPCLLFSIFEISFFVQIEKVVLLK